MTLSAKSPSFLLSLAMAAASGCMLLLSMPGYDLWYLAWVALVPLLLAVRRHQGLRRYILFNIAGLIWSIGCHAWFPDVLGKGLGMLLMVASGLLYAFFLQLGCDLQERFKHNKLIILIVPVVWTALEWLRFVWGENEFTSYGNEAMIGKLKELAAAAQTHIVADVVWNSDAGMHDTALLIGPDGAEIGKTAKINITGGEKEYGFVPGQAWGNVFDTAYGKVGLGVCWDRHVTEVVRALSRSGARLVLMPADDDFHANSLFPHYAASDTVFRAVENRVAIVTGSTAGMSQIITPFGEVTAASGINKREWISGETFTVQEQSFYSRYGDWFGIAATACFVLLAGLSVWRKKS